MNRNLKIGSKNDLYQELISLYRRLEKRINQHSSKYRNMDAKKSESQIEKMNLLKNQRILLRREADNIERGRYDSNWKQRRTVLRGIIRDSRMLLDTIIS